MESTTLDVINEKLKNEPQEILDRVLNYLEEILEDKKWLKNEFVLTEEQKRNLLEIKNRPLEQHTDAETFMNEMKTKYGL